MKTIFNQDGIKVNAAQYTVEITAGKLTVRIYTGHPDKATATIQGRDTTFYAPGMPCRFSGLSAVIAEANNGLLHIQDPDTQATAQSETPPFIKPLRPTQPPTGD